MNPYFYPNPYQMNPQMQINNPVQTQQVIKVNGKNGAMAYQMAANSSALLLDETAPIVWLKTTDGACYPTLTAYDIKVHEELPPVDMHDLESRIQKLEEVMNNAQSHITENERNAAGEQVKSNAGYDKYHTRNAEPTGFTAKYGTEQSTNKRSY